ncbi:MAG TPA: hypothetical protein PK720_04475 [bacterium]|nr:hypothetical protein [bacterium]
MSGAHNIKDEFSQDDVDLLEASLNGLGGAGSQGSVTLTAANTWKQVPTSPPSSPYILQVAPEGPGTNGTFAGVVRQSFTNTGTPSATNGTRFLSGDKYIVELQGGEVIYFASTDATDAVNYIAKVI